jgi:hypothetical protein
VHVLDFLSKYIDLIVNYCSDSIFINSLSKRYLKLDSRTYCSLKKTKTDVWTLRNYINMRLKLFYIYVFLTDLKDFNILISFLAIYVVSLPHNGTHKLLDVEKLMSSLKTPNSWSRNMSDQK